MTKLIETELTSKIKSDKVIPNVITPDIIEQEDPVVEEAFLHIQGVFFKYFEKAKLETGQYLIDKFYDGNYQLAQEKQFFKNRSLRQLFLKLQNDASGNTPGKTWLYDSINLAVDDKKYEEVSAYGKLGLSHKVKLTNTGKISENTKITLIKEAADKGYSVTNLQKRITEEKEKLDSGHISLTTIIQQKQLKTLSIKKLKTIKRQTENRFNKSQDEINLYQDNLKRIDAAIKSALKNKKRDEKKEVDGFGEWITESINICTGCPNDCKYCFSKSRAYRFEQVQKGQWENEIIREHDVNKKHKLYDGRVGFPTSHDITPSNIDSYLIVLKKLLNFGNEVLIVSKPNFECIKRICDESTQYKDNILFRFSIGAMDNKILSFWDNKAPLYEERKNSLQYVFNNGYQTSVSMEPLLDSSNVVKVANDLVEYVTDFIWIGKMNRAGNVKNITEVDDEQILLDQIDIIKNGQTDEKILEIFNKFEKKPELLKKIKWKKSYKEVLGIKGTTKPGMDI
jgi:DNA repair photolyase